MGMSGRYKELSLDRSVHMESMDDYPGVTQVMSSLVEKDGKTTMIVTVLAESKEVRDAIVASGMEHGAWSGREL
jgi:hypothetical protein